MKKTLSILAILTISYSANAQINTFPSTGNVGIGTDNPQSKLHIHQVVQDMPGLIIQGNTINTDRAQHYVALTLDGDYGNATGNYSQIRSYSNLYDDWGSQLSFYTTTNSIANTLVEQMRINANGNVGIGTANPVEKLSVRGGLSLETAVGIDNVFSNVLKYGHYADLESGNTNANRWHGIDATITAGTAENNKMKFRIYPGTGQNQPPIDVMTLNGAGNVGIGTTTPDAKLAVAGVIHSQEVKVDMNGWPDYVFRPNYVLPSLLSVKTYVDKNHHLPEMPTEEEVAKDGIKLGEILKLQTKKIEELTLYLLDQQKQINELKQQLSNKK